MFACFHISGTLPVTMEKLNKSHKGWDNGCDNSLRIRLFMLSGPEALPVFRDFKTVLTSYGVNWTELSILSLCDVIGGSGVLLSSKVFCSQKKSCRSSALSLLSEKMTPCLERGGI